MKEKIQEVHDYFKNKLLTGDFEIKSFNFGTITVLIDKEYEFSIWTGNSDIPSTRKLYYAEYNFMHLSLTNTDAIKLHGIIKPFIKCEDLKKQLRQAEKQVDKLKAQINQ